MISPLPAPAAARPGPRILLVTSDSIAPGASGSGNRAIRFGLIQGLREAGAEVGFFAACVRERSRQDFVEGERALGLGPEDFEFRIGGTPDTAALKRFINRFKPDVALAYGTEPLRLVRQGGYSGLTGIMSVDLEFLPLLHRHAYNLRFGRPKQKLKSAILTPKVAVEFVGIYFDVKRGYPLADFVINHAAHHAKWHAAAHGKPVLYTPNPLDSIDVPAPMRIPASPPRFALVGGIGGIATLTGLAWFARKVYPLLESAIVAGNLEIHLIGKGSLEPSLDRRMPHVIRRGFIEDLSAELATMTAMLVPTPITLGFRTRIMDAFRHGLTVVAHEANSAGMPELRDGVNAVVARSSSEFAKGVLRLAADPEQAERLGRHAFEEFGAQHDAARSAKKILSFIETVRR